MALRRLRYRPRPMSTSRSPFFSALLLTLLGAPTAAVAQVGAVDVQQFKPAGDVGGFVVIEDATTLPKMRPGFGLMLNYAVNPFEVQGSGNGRAFGLVDGIFGGDLFAALGLFDFWEVGIAFPFMQVPIETTFVSNPLVGGKTLAFGAGDLRLQTRLRVLDATKRPVGLAVTPFLTLPTGNSKANLGRGLPGGGVRVAVSRSWKRFGFAANLGWTFLPRATIQNLTTGDELTYGLGLAVHAIPGTLSVQLELEGSLTPGPRDLDGKERFFDGVHSPAELLLDVHARLANGIGIVGGIGKGLGRGFGAPDFRVFAGVQWGILEPRDIDKDGIIGKADLCPTDPEDKDQYQDEDGCPELDNDGDGIVDTADQCPLQVEDKDQFQDEDGCPELDNDGDTLPDAADKCPLDPEDADQFLDEDGCPDVDNDADAILDAADNCPNHPEDVDGWEDQDGCPDPDDDLDGLLDRKDLCPREPENMNGVRDDDGCPDEKLAVKTGNRIVIFEKVYFATNKDTILKRSDAVIAAVANLLTDQPEVQRVRVEGHTDDVGNDAGNQKLSQRRAESVMKALIKLGVAADRLEATGYGEARPVTPNADEASREKNRRVEFTILVQKDASSTPGTAPSNPWGAPASPAPTPATAPSPTPAPAPAGNPWGAPAPSTPTTPTPPSSGPVQSGGNPWAN